MSTKNIIQTISCFVAVYLLIGLASVAMAKAEYTVDANKGARLYNQYCIACHGTSGGGDGDRAKAEKLDPRPRIHANGGYMNQIPDMRLFRVIKYGGKSMNFSHIMPQWSHILGDEDIVNIIGHIRTLATSPQFANRQLRPGCACSTPRPENEKPF